MRRHIVWTGGALLIVIAGAILMSRAYPSPREQMIPRHLENAGFNPPPAAPSAGQFAATLWSDLWNDSGQVFWQSMVPNQAGVLWLALVVMIVVAFDFARPGFAAVLADLGIAPVPPRDEEAHPLALALHG